MNIDELILNAKDVFDFNGALVIDSDKRYVFKNHPDPQKIIDKFNDILKMRFENCNDFDRGTYVPPENYIKTKKPYTAEEEAFLIEHYDNPEYCCLELGKTKRSIGVKIRYLIKNGFIKNKNMEDKHG